MFLKIFLAAITVCSLLGCMGANRKDMGFSDSAVYPNAGRENNGKG